MKPGPVSPLICYCDGHCPDSAGNGTCTTRPGGVCFAAVEVVDAEADTWELEHSYGCLPPDETGLMQCKGAYVPHDSPKTIECCTQENYCNKNLMPHLPDRGPGGTLGDSGGGLELPIALTLLAVLILVAVVLLARRRVRLSKQRLENDLGESDPPMGSSQTERTSGSGSGRPLLVQQTIGKQIEMVESVGKGRYGEVWLARWRGERVAVKVFFTTEEASWFRETEIYQTVLMRHDNILGFIAADIKGTGSWTQMLLITEYHERGSLFDYLQTNDLEVAQMLVMAQSIASGLAHLHKEIFGTKGKPGIAHRDIKSKNILVKRDGECCIADFGLAIRYEAEPHKVDMAPNARVGTLRYMAPEVVAKYINPYSFEEFKMADMYSFSLVLWELCLRCKLNGIAENYVLPYHDLVPSDPSFDDMYSVIVTGLRRPALPKCWQTSPLMISMAELMQECWHPNPTVRLTALRVKINLNDKLSLGVKLLMEKSQEDLICE